MAAAAAKDGPVEVEYVTSHGLGDGVDENDSVYGEYIKLFNRFQNMGQGDAASETEDLGEAEAAAVDEDAEAASDKPGRGSTSDDDDKGEEKPELSCKAKLRAKRLTIAELKQLVGRPDVVEMWDITASDPRMLVYLKAYKNCVPVPRHWCQKRKYLQGKRGIEKVPFQLPDFVAATGIERIRNAVIEKEAGQKSKAKQREKTAGKMGKIDIDYKVLHDAFFR